MSSEDIIPYELPSIDTKEEGLKSKDEEIEHYRQRVNSLKILLEEFQNQLNLYKNRCLGVDSIVYALKETKQENVKLSKHVKALETAISILQKRLTKNGLSNSVNVQDAELFVPGASKQTLDNLAKETARLRSLLKQENGHLGKNSQSEIDDMKTVLEEIESENNELKNKLKNMELIKLKSISEYEGVIERLTKENQEEKLKFEQELKASNDARPDLSDKKLENVSVGCQVQISSENDVQELKELLRQTIERCRHLDEQLPVHDFGYEQPKETDSLDEKGRMSAVSQEEYDKLASKHQEALLMNQRWQAFCKEREKHIQDLNERVQELSDPQMTAMIEESARQKMAAQFTFDLSRKDSEIAEFRKQIQLLSKELTDVRKWQAQRHNENSTVEILKQQIQVCTEDFNTERKDREQAVQKSRALQDENTRLKVEKNDLMKKIEQLKRINEQQRQQQMKASPPAYDTQSSSSLYSGSSPPPHYNSVVSQASCSGSSGSRVPSRLVVQESHNPAAESLSHSPILLPYADYQGASMRGNSQEIVYRPPSTTNTNSDMMNSSMPRTGSNISIPSSNNLSMPPPVKRGGSIKEELLCPKCDKKFSEDVLLTHIEVCTQ